MLLIVIAAAYIFVGLCHSCYVTWRIDRAQLSVPHTEEPALLPNQDILKELDEQYPAAKVLSQNDA